MVQQRPARCNRPQCGHQEPAEELLPRLNQRIDMKRIVKRAQKHLRVARKRAKTAAEAAHRIAQVLAATLEWVPDLWPEAEVVGEMADRIAREYGFKRFRPTLTDGMALRQASYILDRLDYDDNSYESLKHFPDEDGQLLSPEEMFPGAFARK